MNDKLIEALLDCRVCFHDCMCCGNDQEICSGSTDELIDAAADAVELLIGQLTALQAENGSKDKEIERLMENLRQQDDAALAEIGKLRATLSRVKAERDAAKPSAEVLEAIDELVEFARDRMSIGAWLGYVNVLNEWRGAQGKE